MYQSKEFFSFPPLPHFFSFFSSLFLSVCFPLSSEIDPNTCYSYNFLLKIEFHVPTVHLFFEFHIRANSKLFFNLRHIIIYTKDFYYDKIE